MYQWGKNFGGTGNDEGIDIVETTDGGSLLLGFSNSLDNDLSFPHLGQIVVLKLDSIGGIQWINTYGGSTAEVAHKLVLNSDGTFYVAGGTMSDDGQVTNHVSGMDGWILKIDSSGNLIWQRCIGSYGREEAVTMCKTVSGKLLVGFYSFLGDSIFQAYGLNSDIVMLVLDTNGNYVSGKNFGGTLTDNVYDVIPIGNNRNLFIGETNSYDYDVSFLHSINHFDVWIAEISDGVTNSIDKLNLAIDDLNASMIDGQIYLRFLCNEKQILKFNICDVSGRLIFSNSVQVNYGLNYLSIPINVSNGIYLLQVQSSSGMLCKKIAF